VFVLAPYPDSTFVTRPHTSSGELPGEPDLEADDALPSLLISTVVSGLTASRQKQKKAADHPAEPCFA